MESLSAAELFRIISGGHVTTIMRLLMVIRWILLLPAVMLGFWITRIEKTRQSVSYTHLTLPTICSV